MKLGYVIMDDCRRAVTTLAKALRFVPPVSCAVESCVDARVDGEKLSYDVVGVVGPTSSSRAEMASFVLGEII